MNREYPIYPRGVANKIIMADSEPSMRLHADLIRFSLIWVDFRGKVIQNDDFFFHYTKPGALYKKNLEELSTQTFL